MSGLAWILYGVESLDGGIQYRITKVQVLTEYRKPFLEVKWQVMVVIGEPTLGLRLRGVLIT